MKIAIYSRALGDDIKSQLTILINELHRHDIKILLYAPLAEYDLSLHNNTRINFFSGHEGLDSSIDLLISLGGDGTILDTVTLVRDKNIPVVGINFGRLGFLAAISKEELTTAIDAMVNRTYVVEKRTLVHLDADPALFDETPFGLNEFAIHKRDTSPMIKIHTYLNGEFLNSYWADGLIVSTPTGSTGYNMSCGGPIVFPESSSFVITPVAPHNLNVRSIVVPDNNIISFEIEGRSEQFICVLDARREIVDKNVQLAVKKEKFKMNLLLLNENNFLSTLRTKLTWGLDKRN